MSQSRNNIWHRGSSCELDAYRCLVAEIYRLGLGPGGRLPPQPELRRALGFSNFTLSRAMEKLVADGVLRRKPKMGTVIVEPTAADLSAWTVALPSNWGIDAQPSPFYARMICMFMRDLAVAGCQCRFYPSVVPKENRFHRLSDFLNLERDLEGGLIQAILTTTNMVEEDLRRLSDRKTPICFAGSWEGARCGAIIDRNSFIINAGRVLIERGAERLGLLTPSGDLRQDQEIHLARSFALGNPKVTLETVELPLPSVLAGVERSLDWGGRAGESLLKRPCEERPDGLIIIDDHVALGLTRRLETENGYRPVIAVMTHQMAPLAMPLPTIRFMLDDQRLADRALAILLDRLRNPWLPDRVDGVAPCLVEEDLVLHK